MSALATDPSPTTAPTTEPWWRSAVIYQVYPRSFADSDGDGVGDLPGIRAKLPYLAALGVDALWLSPVYVSPMADAGYDVADYRDVDPVFGSREDVDRLVEQAHALGLRLVLDVVPNHTSDEHVWFQAALASAPGSGERARYLFREGRGASGEQPPNSWRSVFGGPAWTRVTEADGTPGQWYLHLFDSKQPDLDWTCPEVRAEFEDVLRFWLDRGVDGFRVDVAHGLVKAEGLPDWDAEQELLEGSGPDGERPPMWDQDGVHEVYRAWRRVLDEYDGDRMLVAEAWVEPAERLAHYVRPDEMHQAFNFAFLTSPWRTADLQASITDSLAASAAVGAPATWVLSNHDVVRHTTRLTLPPGAPRHNGIRATDPQPDEQLGLRRGRAATTVMLALPGSAYLYQGEELGLPEHTTLPDELRQDPTWFRHDGQVAGRDGCRVPLPWQAEAPGFGFGPSGRTWLPQPPSFGAYAADVQESDPSSTLALYRSALQLRRALGLGSGALTWRPEREDVLSFEVSGTAGTVRVLANLGTAPVALPEGARVLLASGELTGDGRVPTDVAVWLELAV
jgi:alpha-glucosidase